MLHISSCSLSRSCKESKYAKFPFKIQSADLVHHEFHSLGATPYLEMAKDKKSDFIFLTFGKNKVSALFNLNCKANGVKILRLYLMEEFWRDLTAYIS